MTRRLPALTGGQVAGEPNTRRPIVGQAALVALLALSWGCVPAANVAPQPLAELASASDGQDQAVALPTLLARLEQADLVCLGEQHDDANHHRFQQALWQALARQSARDGRPLALGLEMVQRPFQPALNDYLAGHLNAAELADELDWQRRWGYDFAFFRPLLHSAHELGAAVIALNAPRELTRQVARHGVEALNERERAQLPELDLDNADHRRFFWDAMGFDSAGGAHGPSRQQHKPPGAGAQPSNNAGTPHGHSSEDSISPRQLRFYTAQVIWDETMAAEASRWLGAHKGGRMLLLAGNGHCHQSAIVGRVKRRNAAVDALSVLLAPAEGELSPLAKRDYLLRLGQTQPKTATAPATGTGH